MPRKSRRREPVLPPLQTYLNEISKIPLLSAREEREIAYRIREGDSAALDQMVRANLRLVVKIARGCTGKGLDLQDLIAAGNLGLLRMVKKYQPERGYRFSTYATWWIRQAMRIALINTSRTIRIPSYMMELLTKWRSASAKIEQELNRPATQEEIAGSLDLHPRKIASIKRAISAFCVLDDTWIAEPVAASDQEAGASEELNQVNKLLEGLDRREAAILRMRFGLDGEETSTLEQIGNKLGLTRERIRQIERQALNRLRLRMHASCCRQ